MLNFITQNWGTLLISVVLIVLVALIVFKMRRDKKRGKSSCGCGCDNCPSSGMCHRK